jgi:hypothetical protein
MMDGVIVAILCNPCGDVTGHPACAGHSVLIKFTERSHDTV